jgi:predicted transcriptional regulator
MDNNFNVVYCPFYEVDVKIWSEMIDKIGQFPLYLLISYSNEDITLDKLVAATNLKPSVVIDTIEYLISNGLLRQTALGYNACRLTGLGKTYLQVYRYIQEFDSTPKLKVGLNAFTGLLENIKNEDFFSNNQKPSTDTLPIRVSKLLVRNHNFSNVKEFMRDKLDFPEVNISNDDYEYVNFNMRPNRIFYVPYVITENSFAVTENNENHIDLIVPIEKVKKFVSHIEIDKYGEMADKIWSIAHVDADLISDKGNKLVTIMKKINELNSTPEDYYNCYSGKKIPYNPETACLTEIKGAVDEVLVVHLDRRYRNKSNPISKASGFLITPVIEQLSMRISIPFDCLEQAGEL